MARKKKPDFLTIIIAIIFICIAIYFGEENFTVKSPLPQKRSEYKEKDYVNEFCKGRIEYVLSDKTRIDCLTKDYAVEFDWAQKWAESIGQSLYYAKQTGLKPAVAIILKTPDDEKYIKRIETAAPEIKIFKIKAFEETIQPIL